MREIDRKKMKHTMRCLKNALFLTGRVTAVCGKQIGIGTVVLRTAIEVEILFTARVTQTRFLERLSGKTPREQSSSGKKIGAESAVLHFVFFIVIVNKMQQSAKKARNKNTKRSLPEVFPLTAILAGSGKTMPFEKRRSRYKETAENKAEAYRVYVEHLFSACDAVDARIFSKGGEAGVIAVISAKDKFPSECVWIEYEVVR